MRPWLLGAAVLLSASAAAHADTTYYYTGQPFTTVSGSGYYTTANRITGSFTLTSPLAANLSNYEVDPVAFSFTDGVRTLDQGQAVGDDFDAFSTDANGDITGYSIVLLGPSHAGDNLMEMMSSGDYTSSESYGTASGTTPGSFTDQPAAVTPEPSSLMLLATGVLSAAGVLRKRFA